MLVVDAVVILGLVDAKVFLSRVVANMKNLLCFVTQQPQILHVHRTLLLKFNCIVDDTECRCIINMNGSGWLGIPHFDKG